jgi:hypothetical protein
MSLDELLNMPIDKKLFLHASMSLYFDEEKARWGEK